MHKTLRFRLRPDIRRRMARSNWSQNRLSRHSGVSSGYMSQLLSGKRHAGPAVRGRLMAAFPELSFDDLFEEVQS